jgi:uncharacterized membrane protein
MSIGPVQLMVVAFDEPEFDGAVLAELERLSEAGLIRIIDLAVVTKDEAGDVALIQVSDLDAEGAEELSATVGALIGLGAGDADVAVGVAAGVADDLADGHLIDAEDLVDIIDEIPPGAAAAIAMLEHRWAIPLRDAIAGAGGLPLVDLWVHPLDLVAIGMAAADAAEG